MAVHIEGVVGRDLLVRRCVCATALACAIVGGSHQALGGSPGRGGVAGGGSAKAASIVLQPRAGAPLLGLTSEQLTRFNLGAQKYSTTLTVANGLGPIFNKSSCANCHNNPIGGPGTQTVTRFGRWDKGEFDDLAALGGSLLQEVSIAPQCIEVVPPEANHTAHRVTNGVLAFGLVEAIPDAALLANRDAQPLAVRGVAHMVGAFEDPPNSPLRVGRFGWKAQVATVLTFSADASLNEMGLTNRFVTQENAPNGDMNRLAQCDLVADPEDQPDGQGFHFIDRVTDFQRFLAPPPQTPKSGMSGEMIFNQIGCAVCHTPSFITARDPNLEDAIRSKVIRPYSDFLLHDMGLNADGIVQGAGTGQLIKTPALWGVRTRPAMWHDGRVASGSFEDRVNEVIALHDDGYNNSQGRFAAAAYAALSAQDKAKVVAFLNSLGRREFDGYESLEDIIDINDFVTFSGCFTGPGSFYTPDSPCAVHDVDQDGDVDLIDFDWFMQAYTGPRRDCNGNNIVDLRDILTGVAQDANSNGVPDSCEPTCNWDVNGNNHINIDDLFYVIGHWGPCPATPAPCAADFDGNNLVNIDDLFAIILFWGQCP